MTHHLKRFTHRSGNIVLVVELVSRPCENNARPFIGALFFVCFYVDGFVVGRGMSQLWKIVAFSKFVDGFF